MKNLSKKELLTILNENYVTTSNLKSFARTNKAVKEFCKTKGFEIVYSWLKDAEEKKRLLMLKTQQTAEAKRFKMSLSKYVKLLNKAKNILADFNSYRSMGEYKYLKLNGVIFTSNHVLNDYAKSCKWKAKYGEIIINLTKKELIEIENIEGLWTIKNEDGSAKWLITPSTKYNTGPIWEDGFLFKTTHSIISLDQAIYNQKRKDLISKSEEDKRKLFVGIDHIRKTGACDPGIRAFCYKHDLNPEHGYTIGFLLDLNDPVAKRYLQAV